VPEVLVVLLVAACCGVMRPRARLLVPGGRDRSSGAPTPVPELDLVALLDLLVVAVEAGAAVPHALRAVGGAAGGHVGDDLARAGASLVLGATWPVAWSRAPALGVALDGLAAAWTQGSAPGPALRVASAEARRARDRATHEAAGRLGVLLVLPLGLCFLPAFVLIGVVPVLAALADALLG
jgi:pilus assembly protein TadC